MSKIEGVVLTGVYGVGKSSVVEEMANCLDQFDVNYGAIDIDWLWWFNISEIEDNQAKTVLFENLNSVITNYLNAGVRRFIACGKLTGVWLWTSDKRLKSAADRLKLPFK